MKLPFTIRIEQEYKEYLERIAQEEGQTASQYTRELIKGHLTDLDYIEEEIDYSSLPSEIFIIEGASWNIRKELPLLTIWLLIVRNNFNYCTEGNFNAAKQFLEKAVKSDYLTNDLRFEFLKVLNNINLLLFEGIHPSRLYFTQPNNMYTANYALLFSEVYNLINNDYDK